MFYINSISGHVTEVHLCNVIKMDADCQYSILEIVLDK